MKTTFAILLLAVALVASAEETETECSQMLESTERVVKISGEITSDKAETAGVTIQ
jgi:hypothetical protein